MLWDLFLIKKLLKSVIYGTVNSTHIHCSQLTKSIIAGWKKKKKKRKTWRRNVNVGFIANQTVTIHVKISVSRLFLVTVWFAMKPTSTFLLHVFLFIFFFSSLQWLTLSIMNSVYVYCSQSHKLYFLATFLLKMGPKTLFTHLKIISLQCFQFQFSVSAKISSIQTH